MSARRFRADVGSTAAKALQGAIPGVAVIGRGDSNGEMVITYRHANLAHPVRIQAVAEDISEYPDGNNFMIFTDSDDAPPEVMKAMEHVQEFLLGITVMEMVMEVANAITSALATKAAHGNNSDDGDEEMTDVEDTPSCHEASDDEDNDFIGNDDEYFGLGTSREVDQQPHSLGKIHHNASPLPRDLQWRIKSDLGFAKQAGFRVGVLNGLGTSEVTGIVCVSIRVSRLDLSEDALIAWDVPSTDYVVLLIKYDTRYFPLEKIAELPAAHTGVKLRIGLCKNYKPAATEAVNAFSKLDNVPGLASSTTQGSPDEAFRTMFLSASLNQFMNDSLIPLIKLRLSERISWDHANELLLHHSSRGLDGGSSMLVDVLQSEDSSRALDADKGVSGHALLSDHLLDAGGSQARSFPLVAMQFAMQYFARCTQYCLRCHRNVEEGFEALRPYVCSNPLCLFQYMTMGLGPNVEHEIVTEPSVVDLLVSLCYSSLQAHSRSQYPAGGMATATTASTASTANPSVTFRIREFPLGLRLRVPNLFHAQSDRPLPISATLEQRITPALVFSDDVAVSQFHVDQWLALRYRNPDHTGGSKPNALDLKSHAYVHNARITGVFPDQRRVEVALMSRSDSEAVLNAFPADAQKADVYTYDVDFDTLSDAEKSVAMQHIINTLPRISKIREYLLSHPNATLRSYEQVSSATATLLVWIVSSNRSCIIEIGTVNQPDTAGPSDDSQQEYKFPYWTVKEKRRKEFIPGMNGYIQFRFSQGSPDKEVRFNKALQEMAQTKDLSGSPTIFAWHGSDVANWHSILRTGLDFKEIKNGRSFGNGVYFSPYFNTSTGYTASANGARWPNSDLNILSVLSLNEIINVPEEFVARTPHYVVQEQDWHQCRYLFVSTTVRSGDASLSTRVSDDGAPVDMLPQPPQCQVRGPNGQALSIPIASMPTRLGNSALGGPSVKNKASNRALVEESEESSDEDKKLLAPDGRGSHPRLSRSSSMDTIIARDR